MALFVFAVSYAFFAVSVPAVADGGGDHAKSLSDDGQSSVSSTDIMTDSFSFTIHGPDNAAQAVYLAVGPFLWIAILFLGCVAHYAPEEEEEEEEAMV